jgi:hypothetical protein
MLPPGCARLETNPLPTGSDTHANTIGIARVSACNAAVAGVLMVTSASRFSWTSSLANRRMRSTLPAPSIHPSSKSRLRKAASQAWASGSVSASELKTPTRRILSGCCAGATSGHMTAVPPASEMNSRRRVAAPAKRPR